MLAYSQFWECIKVQRILQSLVNFSAGIPYDPNVLISREKPTANVYENIISVSRKSCPMISKLLDAIYYNKIRNAFAHSNFCSAGDRLLFFFPQQFKKKDSIVQKNFSPKIEIESISLSVWEDLFGSTKRFISDFFSILNDYRLKMEKKESISFKLPVISEKEFTVKFEKGKWVFDQ